MEDAPIFKVLSTYQMVSITDLWTFLYDSLSPLQVERFKKCVLLVLSAEDPTLNCRKNAGLWHQSWAREQNIHQY